MTSTNVPNPPHPRQAPRAERLRRRAEAEAAGDASERPKSDPRPADDPKRRRYRPQLPPEQLALDLMRHVPETIRDHGLQRVAVAMRVGQDRRDLDGTFWSGRRHVSQAFLQFSHVDVIDAGPVQAALTFDVDHLDGQVLGGLPEHNWAIETPRGFHVTWCLADPVALHLHARRGPLAWLERIEEYYLHHLRADPAFSGLGGNPERPRGGPTHWGAAAPYGLAELAAPIPRNWRRPRKPLSILGRNRRLFEAVCAVAGSDPDGDLLEIARSLNPKVAADLGKPPMDDAEVQRIAGHVERYREQWKARGWHAPAWIERQRRRGRKGGQKGTGELKAEAGRKGGQKGDSVPGGRASRGAGPGRPHLYEPGCEPWTLEDISRRTWERRR